jgi:hypothetical protein
MIPHRRSASHPLGKWTPPEVDANGHHDVYATTFDASTGVLSGVPTLPARKPLVKTKRVKSKNGAKLVKKLVARAPLARTFTLYFVATDSLGQRDSQKLRLTVRP